ncbi:MAG: c-type cytochrome [Chloroflexi bacterium]|nr:c-type cytochrome [Chloroflexota bacterium]
MFQGMIFPKIENRILVGVLAFVLTMVLLGWAAINEGGRMAAFDETYHARSIEQGAVLFATNCTTCHGPNGLGGAKGPALNNPQLFGHDFFPEVTREINTLNVERTTLEAEAGRTDTTQDRLNQINARIQEIDARIEELDAPRRQQLASAIEKGYDPQRPNRLQNVLWNGTLESFVLTTLIHGRPVSNNYWPIGSSGAGMVAWSQTAGGPLRMDQLEDLTAYILNWDRDWTLDDLFAVQQFAIQPSDPGPLLAQIEQLQASGGELQTAVGVNVRQILTDLETVTGDPARGDQLYHSQARSFNGTTLACNGCHMPEGPGTGPQTNGTMTRIETERLQDPALAGYTPEQYLVESIVQPGNYVVPDFQNVMIPNFGQNLSLQDLADLIAYLETTG